MNDEPFTPENVDEQIDQQLSLLWKDQARQPSASVVRGLHALYEEDVRSTAHVWERLARQVGEHHLAAQDTEHFNALPQQGDLPLPQVPRGANASRRQKRQSLRTGQTPLGRRVNLLVAVLVMIALVGSLVTVLHEIHPNLPVGTGGNTPGQTVYSTVQGPEDPLFVDLAWSPDSRRVAASGINRVQIWDATTGANLINVHLPADMLYPHIMAWSPNGRWIAISGLGTEIVIADARTGALVHQYSVESVAESLSAKSGFFHLSASLPASGLDIHVSGLVWSPNSRWLAVTIDGDYAYRDFSILDAQTGALVHHFTDDTGENFIDVASWSPDGKYLAARVMRGTRTPFQMMVWVWEMSTYQVVFKQNGDSDAGGLFEHGDQIVWQPQSDNLAFAAGRPNPTIALWDVARNKLLKQYNVASYGLFAWSPDGAYLASVSYPNQPMSDPRIVVIDVQSGRQVYVYTQHDGRLAALAWSPDGKYIVSSGEGGVKVWIAP